MTSRTDADARPTVRTTCPYCGVGCGVLATPDDTGGLAVAGDPAHPANLGRLCSKGSALGETVGHDTRLMHPMLRTSSGDYERVGWDTALDVVADGIARIARRDGPDALAFYLSGQLLTEDYYVANKLMKGFLGSANVDTNSRLCMSSSVAGHRRAFGSDTVPGLYADLDEADLIVLVGSNAAWCHPVLFQRMLRNKADRGAKIVVVDPRRTASADEADLHLAIAPGMDTVLFAGLLVHLAERGHVDRAFVAEYTTGFDDALARARQIAPSLAAVAGRTGIVETDLQTFFALWAGTAKVVTAWSQGVNQSAQGSDKVNAIVNCHLATGRIGKPGLGPFSLTGQPNAMGGREVGGLANMLAAHMGFGPVEVDRVRRFWNAPGMATREGLKAVAMMDAVAQGRIRALWVMATNPAVSLPRADHVRAALGRLDLLVVSEVVRSNDTVAAGAHVLLPAAAWGEKDGTVTNSERRISRQRAILAPAGEARPDWWIVCEVAKRLGFRDAFGFDCAAAVFREHAALSAFENDGSRDFDIGALAGLTDREYGSLAPTLWPRPAGAGKPRDRLFADGGFFHADGRARFVAPDMPALAEPVAERWPLLLNTGRVRDHWHTMTRTGLSPRLAQHRPAPFLDMAPDDAARLGLRDGDLARVSSRHGRVVLRVRVEAGQKPGEVFAPIHWSEETSSDGRVGALANPATDPISGQPELKATPVAVERLAVTATGILVTRDPAKLPAGWWWSHARLTGGHGYLVASTETVDVAAVCRDLAGAAATIEFHDAEAGTYRAARIDGERLAAALFLASGSQAPEFELLGRLIAMPGLSEAERRLLLSGHSADGMAQAGPTVCACFGVGLGSIVETLTSGRAASVAEIGRLLKAGTNCGSCLPEIKRLVATHGRAEALHAPA